MASAETILREELERAKETINRQNEVLEAVSKPAFKYATLIGVDADKKMMTVILDGALVVIGATKEALEYKRGSTLLINQQGFVESVVPHLSVGSPSVVVAVDKDWVELNSMGGTRIALIGDSVKDLKSGDKVMTDMSGFVVIEKLPQAAQERFAFNEVSNVSWNDIGGQEEAKQQMIEAVELPLKQSKIYDFYGKPRVKGILLFGPPGCGKTLLAKATATAIANAYGDDAVSGFMYVKGPELLNSFVGESESNIRNLFSRARKHKEMHGTQAVIFIDEADALLGSRSGGRNMVSGMEKTIVPSFLTEMDGLEESAALVILATNRPTDLDPAVVREGRIDRKIRVARPTQVSAIEIFKLHLKNVPLSDGLSVDVVAERASEALFSEHLVLYYIVANGEERKMTMASLVSGATIAGVVEHAVTLAMRRDLQSNSTCGVHLDDVFEAVYRTYSQNLEVNHDDAIRDFVAGADITQVRKVHHEQSIPA